MPIEIDIHQSKNTRKSTVSRQEMEDYEIQLFSVWKKLDGRKYIILDLLPSGSNLSEIVFKDLKTLQTYLMSAENFMERIRLKKIKRFYGEPDN